MALEAAQRMVFEAARAIGPTGVEEVALRDAARRVIARDVLADRDQPAFHRAAMDGYAVRHRDVGPAGATLRVVGEVPAGTCFEGEVGPGEAVAIMTGAPVPVGADAVQMVEKARASGDQVTLEGPLRPWQHIAPRGEDVRTGELVAPAGRMVDALVTGALASVGCARVPVHRRPTVTVLATGDELVEVEQTPLPHQIRETNRHTTVALVEAAGGEAIDGGRIADEEVALRAAIRGGLRTDFLVLSGGVSAGRYDLVADALRDEGVEVLFHKISIKPGKPVLVGRRGKTLVFGLPGNPVSAFVTAHLLLLPALAMRRGAPRAAPWHLEARCDGALPAALGRVTFHAAALEGDGPELSVRPVPCNGSGDQVGFSRANCLVRREPRAAAVAPGDRVTVMLLHPPV